MTKIKQHGNVISKIQPTQQDKVRFFKQINFKKKEIEKQL